MIADGAHDSRRIFRFLADNCIEPLIKANKASVKAKGYMPTELSVLEQKEDLDTWKK